MPEVTLISKDNEEVSTSLTAQINSEGDLVFSGQDLGRLVEKIWKDLDYEYWLTVPSHCLNEVKFGLEDDFPQVAKKDLLPALQVLFADGAFTTLSDFKRWLDSREIESSFFSYG